MKKRYFLLAGAFLLSNAFAEVVEIDEVYEPLRGKFDDIALYHRVVAKSKWRARDTSAALERRVKILTNLEWKAGQRGGLEESADPAPPIVLTERDGLPPGMTPGTYWANSGPYLFRSAGLNAGMVGGREAFERLNLVFLFHAANGELIQLGGGVPSPKDSWGWDGRFELQPRRGGGTKLVYTLGSMELPSKLRGGTGLGTALPTTSEHNFSRSRHLFTPLKLEGENLYLIDEGSILGDRPAVTGDWISYVNSLDEKGRSVTTVASAHGYGENYIPDPKDPRRMWKDEFGYPIRIFDRVVRDVRIERRRFGRRTFVEKLPATTRSIAYRMDPSDASRRVATGTLLPDGRPADAGIEIMTESLPTSPDVPVYSSIRMMSLAGRKAEIRTLGLDGRVLIERNVEREMKATLVEGFNPVPGVVTFPSGKQYFLGTFSASEYTAGARPERGMKKYRYGTYLGYRAASEGPLGRYLPVTEITEHGEDFVDLLENFTETFGLGWGVGRPQVFRDESGQWWLEAHFVDTDLIPEGLPKSGYPPTGKDFEAYRRHKAILPIRWIERDGKPAFILDDSEITRSLQAPRTNSGKRVRALFDNSRFRFFS